MANYFKGTADNASTLNGQAASYYLNYNNLTNKPSLNFLPLSGGTLTGSLIMNGLSIQINIPKTGSWARGLSFQNSGTIGMVGMYGTDTTINNMFLGLGNAPWNGINSLTVTNTDVKFNNVSLARSNGTYSSMTVGNATTATKLSTSAGSATQPIYFSSGKPVSTTYTLAKSVPSNAVFTDTTYKAGSGLYLGNGTFKVYCPRVQKSANSLPGKNSVMIEEYSPGSTYNLPDSATWYHIITIEGTDVKYATQLALGMTADRAYYRRYSQEAWGSWKSIINTDTTYTLSSFGIIATATELNYCDGVTSNIQTQLNGKLPTNGKAASATKADTATTATTATNSNQLGGVAAANFINTSDTVILKGVV